MPLWNNLNPGQYSIPFSFLVPHNLPCSFYAKGQNFLAEISYTISAELSSHSTNFEKLECREKVKVKPSMTRPFGTYTKEDFVNLKVCCRKKGGLGLAVSLEKDILAGGEKTKIVIDVDTTQSSMDVKSITCYLVQILSFKVKEKTFTTTIREPIFTTGAVSKGMAGEKLSELTMPECNEGDIEETVLNVSDTNLAYKLYHTSFPKGKSVLTTKSNLIETKHYISVICNMNHACANSPEIKIPIEITSEEIRDNFASAPQWWQPQVMEPVNIAISPDLDYAPSIDLMNDMNQMSQSYETKKTQ